MRGIIGRKISMTQLYNDSGHIIPVTIVEVLPNVILQRKTLETDGYNAIQLGYGVKKEHKRIRSEKGHSKKNGLEIVPKFIKEFRDLKLEENVKEIKPSIFKQGDIVDVKGVSKGKGFAGAIKRHGKRRGPMSHGSGYHRGHGSSGPLKPSRVFPGLKMPGRMGGKNTTIQNLEIARVSDVDNYILIAGAIPGPKKGYVLIREALKNPNKNTGRELLDVKRNKEKQELIEQAKHFNIKVTADMENEQIEELLKKAREKEGGDK